METLDKHFRALTKAAFDRFGFGQGELVARWPEIVGEGVAAYCEPEKIRWPRAAGEAARRAGGTLHITALPGRALDVQYEAPRLIERINRFFGFAAISNLKITQGPLTRKSAAEPAALPPAPARLTAPIHAVGDTALEEALTRLAAGVASRPPSSPQGK